MKHEKILKIITIVFIAILGIQNCGPGFDKSEAIVEKLLSGKTESFIPERIVAAALKNSLIIQMISGNEVISVTVSGDKPELWKGKHALTGNIIGTTVFSHKDQRIEYIGRNGEIKIEKLRLGDNGYVIGRFYGNFPNGDWKGTFKAFIDKNLSFYKS